MPRVVPAVPVPPAVLVAHRAPHRIARPAGTEFKRRDIESGNEVILWTDYTSIGCFVKQMDKMSCGVEP